MKMLLLKNAISKKPLVQKVTSLIDNSKRDCHNIFFHTFDHIIEYDLNFANIGNNETVNFTISDKSMGMYDLNKKLTVACGNGYIFNQINNFKIKNYSNLSKLNIWYNLKHRIPMCHRFF